MSDWQRARRLPVFVDEDQWRRAYAAAKETVQLLFSQGKIDVPSGPVNGSLDAVAVEIATAALRAAAQDDEGDISDLVGVHIDEIGSSTSKGQGRS